MTAQNRSADTTNWLWLLAFFFGWPTAVQTIGMVVTYSTLPIAGSAVYVSLGVGLGLTILARFVARFAFERGAPRGVWIAAAAGSVPLLALITVAYIDLAGRPDLVPRGVLLMLGLALALLGPPVVMFIEGRRIPSVTVGEALSPDAHHAGT